MTGPPKTTLETTQERLLEAAGRVFAERGFRQATVREICRRAGANVAAVNYHFGDKARLYAETLTYGARTALAKFPPDAGLRPRAAPEEALHAFVRSFLRRFLDVGTADWHGKLCAREMVEPTAALDGLVREVIAPLSARLNGIMRALLGPTVPAERVRLAQLSVVGQCLFYHHSRPVLERLFGPRRMSGRDIERLARHITDFSLGAIRHLRSTHFRQPVRRARS
jgi:AcrR family transcriptional regulator